MAIGPDVQNCLVVTAPPVATTQRDAVLKPNNWSTEPGGKYKAEINIEAALKKGGQQRAASIAKPASATFPIVGIGASARGLEALEQFFTHVPAGRSRIPCRIQVERHGENTRP